MEHVQVHGPSTIAVAEAVRGYAVLVVLGDPGAGKSTLLRYLAIAALQNDLEQAGLPVREDGATWLPIVIPCASYAAAHRTTMLSALDFIHSYLNRQFAVVGSSAMVNEALSAGRVLLLFDGLDEVLEASERLSIAQSIDNFLLDVIPLGNRAVLTSRIIGYNSATLTTANAVITLRNFDDAAIGKFLRAWCVAYEQFVQGHSQKAERDGQHQAEQLITEISSNRGATRLAGNPLLLTIMALVQRQGVRLPEQRVELYDIYARTLIESWHKARSLSGVALLNPLDSRLTADLLGELALWMQEYAPSGTASAQQLLPVLIEAQRQRGNPVAEMAAVAFLHDVQRYSGLLVERGPDSYSFLHLTFQEYFAARALADMPSSTKRWKALKPHIFDLRWREIILLTAGELCIMKRRDVEVSTLVLNILKTVAKPSNTTITLFTQQQFSHISDTQLNELEEFYLKRTLLLSGELLAENLRIRQDIIKKIVRRLIDLSYSKIRQQALDARNVLERLPDQIKNLVINRGRQIRSQNADFKDAPHYLHDEPVHDVSVATDLLDSTQGTYNNIAIYPSNTLIEQVDEINRHILQGTLTSIISKSKGAAMVAQRSEKYEETLPSFVSELIDKLHHTDSTLRRDAVQALGQLGLSSAQVRDALVRSVRYDAEAIVRAAAIEALNAIGVQSKEVRLMLLAALGDQDTRVRDTAYTVLMSTTIEGTERA